MRRFSLAALAVLATLATANAASAFCGFYVGGADKKLFNNATQVVLMREGTRTVLSMQNNYEGPPDRFALVIPVPVVLHEENVKTLPRDVFDKIDQLDSPRLVEYWEQDPCAELYPERSRKAMAPSGAMRGGGSGGFADETRVKIEAQFTVGEYEIVILSAEDSTGLDTWLKREKYNIPEGAEPVLRPYVAAGMKFFVAKVDPTKVNFDQHGQAMLSPLRFHYDSESFSLPVRLGLLNAKGDQDLVVHILAKGQRYEVANYGNVTVPTNLDVNESAKEDFGARYVALFDDTLARHPKSVITEYAWDASTCDPCPGPALSYGDFATLGSDALPAQGAKPMPSPGGGFGGRGRGWGGGGGFVITRLHARYNKDSLGEDLVFRTAPPIVGGREERNATGTLDHDAKPSSFNNFQARYAIRHPWTGPIACDKPVRGNWGGPPPGVTGSTTPKPAQKLAFVKRDATLLASFDLPSELKATGPAAVVVGDAGSPDAGAAKAASGSTCGACSVGGDGASPWPLGLSVGAIGLAFLRRVRRKTERTPRP